MEDDYSFVKDDALAMNQNLQVTLECLSDSVIDSMTSHPSASSSATLVASSQNVPSSKISSSNFESPKSASNIPTSMLKDDFQFKTPSPIRRPMRSTNPSQPSGSVSSVKKNPAVKIASFAKASPVDRLAPSSGNANLKISKNYLNDSSPSISTHIVLQSSTGGSKQPITQTSLPTPALNAALRSFFNHAAKSNNNSIHASQSDDEEEEEEDEDVEEEEILVYMQFDSKLDSDLLQPHTPFKIIGVDSEKPVLQLGNQVFEGNWTDTVGTAVFFEENPSASPGDPVFMKNPPSTLNYHSKTQKALIMSRIFVKPKSEDADSKPMVPMAIVEVAPCNQD